MRSFLLFIVGGVGFGAFSLGLAYWLRDQEALIPGGAAFALTFVPAVAALAWVLCSFRSSLETQLLASLGSSGLRMAIALGGGFLLTQGNPQTFDVTFWFWLVLFYLSLLAFEITLIVWRQPTLNGSPQA